MAESTKPSSRTHHQLAKAIHQLILTENLQPGNRLPSERELSEKLGVCRNSIREALRAIEILGIIESRHGEGNIIRCKPDNCLVQPLSEMFKLSGGTFREMLEVRRGLETEAVRLAAIRATEEQTELLRCFVGEMRIANCEAVSVAIDAGFHRQIAEFTNNRLLISYLTSVHHLMEDPIHLTQKSVFSMYTDLDLLVNTHEAICEAIVEHQPEEAVEAMNHHFDIIFQSLDQLEPTEKQ